MPLNVPTFKYEDIDDYHEILELFYQRVEDIKGNCEYQLLRKYAELADDGYIMEIGASLGISTVWLAIIRCAMNKGKVISVEKEIASKFYLREGHVTKNQYGHSRMCAFLDNIVRMGVQDCIIPVLTESGEAKNILNIPLSLVYIDGDHSYEQCSNDINLWKSQVKSSGYIVLHDWHPEKEDDGVCQAVAEHLEQDCQWDFVESDGMMVVYQKKNNSNHTVHIIDNNLKVGIIGLGGAGNLHADTLQYVNEADLVAGCDINQTVRTQFNLKWHVPVYHDFADMYKNADINAVIICTYAPLHYPIIKEVCDTDIGSIFCEKPLAYSLNECNKIKELTSNIVFGVNHQCRFSQHHIDTLRRIGEGEIGVLQNVWIDSWADLFDYGVHFMDTLNFYLGMPKYVLGQCADVDFDTRSGKGHFLDKATISFIYYDSIKVILETISNKGEFIFIGDKGNITVPLKLHPPLNNPFLESLQSFVDEVHGKKTNMVDVNIATEAISIILAIQESYRLRTTIKFPVEQKENPLELMLC